jgi:biopolymer transport protein ExbB
VPVISLKSILFLCFSFLALATTSFGQDLASIQAAQQSKLDDAVRRLTAQRLQINEQQIPLARNLRTLEVESKKLREALYEARRTDDSRSLDLETLRNNVEVLRQEYNYITSSLLSEYNSSYQSNLSVGELANYGEDIRALNLLLENPDATRSDRLESSLSLINDSVDRIHELLGGKRYAGQALNSEGRLTDGQFLQLGPLLYFSGDESGIIEETKVLQARIHLINTESSTQIAEISKSGKGKLPMDLSLGNALALQSTKDSLLVHIQKGGIWAYPIILFALVATIVALFKFVQIMTIRQPAPNTIYDIAKLLRADKQTEALQLAQAQPLPAREMLVQAVEHSQESIELVEEAMYESMLNTQPKLERYLNIIAVTASVAPLLGLLGTVTGIIKTFNLMRVFGAGDPKPLISGISEALITTELGLVLAIPALIIHALLTRKVSGVMAHIEKLSVALLNTLSRNK